MGKLTEYKTFRCNNYKKPDKMDNGNDFLSSFNISEPVFAKKSAPPPPIPNDEGPDAFSSPSSSLLDTSNENSSAAANSFTQTPTTRRTATSKKRSEEEEPMDAEDSVSNQPSQRHQRQQQQFQQQQQLHEKEKDDGKSEKRSRNRSRAKRAENKGFGSQAPDVPSLLAALENQNLPPLPTSDPLPPPPHLLLLGRMSLPTRRLRISGKREMKKGKRK